MSPGSYKRTTVLPATDGREHPVDCAQVPAARHVPLVNPCLKRGDLAVMAGFCWHHAMPMLPEFADQRHGLYMKLRAADSPPACGPLLMPTAARDALGEAQQHVVPYHRRDGTQTIEETRIIVEDTAGKILLCKTDDGALDLPGCATGLTVATAVDRASGGNWDESNVIGAATEHASALLGVEVGWATFVADYKTETADGKEDRICRVYGHRMMTAEPVATPEGCVWMGVVETLATDEADWVQDDPGSGSGSSLQKSWIQQWVDSVDSGGRAVQRGYGVAPGPAGDFIVHNNQGPTGNQEGQFYFADWRKGKPAAKSPPEGWTGSPGYDLPVTDAGLLPKVAH